MSRLTAYLIPLVMLVVFAAVLVSPGYIKEYTRDGDSVTRHLSALEVDLKHGKWAAAEADLQKLENAWRQILPKAQFGLEHDTIENLDTSLAQLKGAVKARDASAALIFLSAVQKHWDDIGR